MLKRILIVLAAVLLPWSSLLNAQAQTGFGAPASMKCSHCGKKAFVASKHPCVPCVNDCQQKTGCLQTACFHSFISEPGLALCFEALTAVHGTISAGLERNLGLAAAAIADHSVHLAGSTTVAVLGTTGSAAGGAAAGLILEALLREKFLLTRRENEFVAALTAGQSFVFVHG